MVTSSRDGEPKHGSGFRIAKLGLRISRFETPAFIARAESNREIRNSKSAIPNSSSYSARLGVPESHLDLSRSM